MGKVLTEERIEAYRRDGFVHPIRIMSADQAEVLRRAVATEVDGVRLFDSVQATWNLLEPSTGEALKNAHAAGMGVIVKEALANGRLTPRNTDPAFAHPLAVLKRQAARLDAPLDALALAAALAQPWADVVLSGAATVDHLQSNVNAHTVAWDDEAAHTLAALAEPPATYWKTRSALAWT